jgi:hypothetical protein
VFFHDKDFKGKTSRGNAFEDCDKYRSSSLSDMLQNILIKQPAEKLSISLHTIITHQEVRPSALGGGPTFQKNTFLTRTLMDEFHQGHWACQSDPPPTSEEMKTYFTWYRILLLRAESGNTPMIPTNSLQHAPAVRMLNHLIWFLESAVGEDQDEQSHYSPGSSFFIQGAIALREQTTVVGDARWEQSMEHCRAFSSITM